MGRKYTVEQFKKIVNIINKIFDKRNKNAALVINTQPLSPLGAVTDEIFKFTNTYGRSNAKFQSCSELFDSKQIEILLIPDVLVATTFHFYMEDLRKLTVPIGFVSSDKDKIEEITKNIREWSFKPETKFHDDFEKNNTGIGETLFIKVVAPVLEYYEDKQKEARKKKKEKKIKDKKEK